MILWIKSKYYDSKMMKCHTHAMVDAALTLADEFPKDSWEPENPSSKEALDMKMTMTTRIKNRVKNVD